MDFNDAPSQREGDLIPNGTIAPVQMTVRPGGHGPGGFLKRTNDGSGLMLDCEFVVLEGPQAKRKFWGMYMMEGNGSDGHAKAVDIARAALRAILESARGVRPDDMSDSARAARSVAGFGDFDGIRFIGKIGIETGKLKEPRNPNSERYPDKNKLAEAVTPDRPQWAQVAQVARQQSFASMPSGNAAAHQPQQNGAGVQRPAWG